MPISDVVIDLSHHNTANLSAAKQSGIVGVIHKATGSLGFQDPKYAARRQEAQSAGLLWGAYHFATGSSDGAAQAEFFLHTVGPTEGVLLVLDIEENPFGPSMTLDQAHAFVSHIQSITGKWPGVYSGGYLKQLLGSNIDATLKNCWFWLAQYTSSSNAVVPKTWPEWTFWQYTETGVVPGITGNCDRDRFKSTPGDLQAFWQSQSAATPPQAVAPQAADPQASAPQATADASPSSNS
jgi:lysozyme